MQIAVIGGGTMGEAIIRSLMRKKLAAKQDIILSDILQSRSDMLNKKLGIKVAANNVHAIKDVQVIILAVKPQDFIPVLEQISNRLEKQLIVSIVAGFSLGMIKRKLNYEQIVRAMPNTPAQVGKGMTAWTAEISLTKANHEIAKKILSALGEEHYFDDEKYIDMATAISGSGPAYVFLFIEALIDAGVHIGLPRSVAQKLVIETIIGSAEAVKKMNRHPAELRNMVTSPGGTTTEALLHLESGRFRSLLVNAVTAAYNKAKNLGIK